MDIREILSKTRYQDGNPSRASFLASNPWLENKEQTIEMLLRSGYGNVLYDENGQLVDDASLMNLVSGHLQKVNPQGMTAGANAGAGVGVGLTPRVGMGNPTNPTLPSGGMGSNLMQYINSLMSGNLTDGVNDGVNVGASPTSTATSTSSGRNEQPLGLDIIETNMITPNAGGLSGSKLGTNQPEDINSKILKDFFKGLSSAARNDGVTPPAYALGYLGGSGAGNGFDRFAYGMDLASQIGLNFGAGFMSGKNNRKTTADPNRKNKNQTKTGLGNSMKPELGNTPTSGDPRISLPDNYYPWKFQDGSTSPVSENTEEEIENQFDVTRYFNPMTSNSPAMNFFKSGEILGSDYTDAWGGNVTKGIGAGAGLGGGILGTVKAAMAGRGVGKTNRYLQDRGQDYVRELMMDDYAERDRMDLFNDSYMQYYGIGFQDGGGIPVSKDGLYKYPNQPVKVPSNHITMKGIDKQVLAIPNNDKPTMMFPEFDYVFPNSNSVTEVPVMQDGGEFAEASGRKITGGEKPSNAELEKNEFVQFPNGEIPQVEGKMHSQGGENIDLPDGSKVLSDNIKIGAENKKRFNKYFGLNLKAKDTYATVMAKLDKKSGVEAKQKEMEDYMSELEKTNDIEDEATRNLNLQHINNNINGLNQELEALKGVRNELFGFLFESQEMRKSTGGKNIRKRPPLEQPNSIQIALEDGSYVDAMQDGGDIRFFNHNDMQAVVKSATDGGYKNLKDYISAKMQDGGYLIRTVKDLFEEGAVTPEGGFTINEGIPTVDTKNTITIQPSKGDGTFAGGEQVAVSLDDFKARHPWYFEGKDDWSLDNEGDVSDFQTSYNDELSSRMSEAGYSDEDINQTIQTIGFGSGDGFQGVQVVDDKFGDWTSTRTMLNFSPSEGEPVVEEPVVEEEEELDPLNPPAEQRGSVRMLNVPRRLPPDPVLLGTYNLPEFDRMSPIKVSPETALRENNRALNVAKELIGQNVGSQQGANLANIISEVTNNNNQAVVGANTQNAQFKQQADGINLHTQQAENTARNNALKAFGLESVLALDNTRRDNRAFIDILRDDAWKADNEARELNIIDAMYDNFSFDQFGNVVYQDTGDELTVPENSVQASVLSGGSVVGQNDVPNGSTNSDLVSLLNSGQISEEQLNSYMAINQILNQ